MLGTRVTSQITMNELSACPFASFLVLQTQPNTLTPIHWIETLTPQVGLRLSSSAALVFLLCRICISQSHVLLSLSQLASSSPGSASRSHSKSAFSLSASHSLSQLTGLCFFHGLCFFTWSHAAFSLSASHLPSHRALLLQSGSASSRSHSTYSLSTSHSLSHQALLLGLT